MLDRLEDLGEIGEEGASNDSVVAAKGKREGKRERIESGVVARATGRSSWSCCPRKLGADVDLEGWWWCLLWWWLGKPAVNKIECLRSQ